MSFGWLFRKFLLKIVAYLVFVYPDAVIGIGTQYHFEMYFS